MKKKGILKSEKMGGKIFLGVGRLIYTLGAWGKYLISGYYIKRKVIKMKMEN